MKLTGYGIVLRRVSKDDVQQIRMWRNAPHVLSQMFFQEEISDLQQLAWFDSIDNPLNYYFIISAQGEDVGVIYAKNVNPTTLTGEGGIFMGKQEILTTQIPALASLLLLRFCFEKLGVNASIAQVKADNSVARSFNEMLGYECISQNENKLTMVLTKEGFLKSKNNWNLGALNNEEMVLEGEVSPKNLPQINNHLALKG